MKNDDEKEKLQDEEKLIKWLLHKEKALDFLNVYGRKVAAAKQAIDEKIENKDPGLLREQATNNFMLVGDISLLLAKAEKQYREMQKEASLNFPSSLKSDARRMWLDGECSNFRYQRDIFEYLLQGLRDKYSMQKSILSSLTQEMRDMKLND